MKTKRSQQTSPAWDAWYDSYLNYYQDVEKKAAGTIRDARCTLNRVSWWLHDQGISERLWQVSFHTYLAWLEASRRRGMSPRTLGKCISHLNMFLTFSYRSGRCECNVLKGFRLQDTTRPSKPRWLTVDEARRLIEACPSSTAEQRRERIIVLLFYGCGVRTKELRFVRLQDVDHERQELFIQRGKGDRQRTIPIPSGVYTELLAYLRERGGQRGFLLRSLLGKQVSTKELGEVVKAAAKRAGLEEGVTPKVLRHSFATHLMDRGVDLAVIASLMGHRSPQETGVYLHVLEKDQEAMVEHLNEGDVA
jgi:integrase/recombinase XerD